MTIGQRLAFRYRRTPQPGIDWVMMARLVIVVLAVCLALVSWRSDDDRPQRNPRPDTADIGPTEGMKAGVDDNDGLGPVIVSSVPPFGREIRFGSVLVSSVRRQCEEYFGLAHAWWFFHNKKWPDFLKRAYSGVRADPWSRPYRLVADGDKARVISLGPDGKEGTKDDIVFPERDR